MGSRLTWIGLGAVAGFLGAAYSYGRLRAGVGRLRPEQVADAVVLVVDEVADRVGGFAAEVRREADEVEREIRAGRRLRPTDPPLALPAGDARRPLALPGPRMPAAPGIRSEGSPRPAPMDVDGARERPVLGGRRGR